MIPRKVDDSDVLLVLLPQIRLFLLDVNVGVVRQADVQPLVSENRIQPVLLAVDRIEIKSSVFPELVEILVG